MIKRYQLLSIYHSISNTTLHFRHSFLLSASSSQNQVTSYSSLLSHHQVNNKCNRVKGQHWRLLIYILHNFLLYNNIWCVFRSNHQFLKVSQIPKENICVGVYFFFKMMKLYKDICSALISHTSAKFFLIYWHHKHL